MLQFIGSLVDQGQILKHQMTAVNTANIGKNHFSDQ